MAKMRPQPADPKNQVLIINFRSRMSSEYVARRVLDVAKRPHRSLIIPWWFRILTTFDMLFPIFTDWIAYAFSKKNHKLD